MATPISYRLLRRFQLLGVAAATCLGCIAPAGAAADRPPPKELLIGVDYVVPAFIPGAKVRTPESIDSALMDDLAARVGLKFAAVRTDHVEPFRGLGQGEADLLLVAAGADVPVPSSVIQIATGYSAGPMAIMRDDTDIRKWQQLKGRTVCLSQGSLYIGRIAARYGAIEKIFKAPADALLALRTGGCDATVHDDVMLTELIRFPEWKKFSARLPAGPRTPLVFIVPVGDARTLAAVKQVAYQWKKDHTLQRLTKSRVRDIAFEVYLDQVVADCH